MGGRKGYSLKRIVHNPERIRRDKKNLFQGIKDKDIGKVVSASAKILSKSEEALDSLAHSFLFVNNIKEDERERLNKDNIKQRRLKITQKWSLYRKKEHLKFDSCINRDIVDTATRTIGGKK